MRLLHFVEVVGRLQVNRAGVHTPVDPQHRHAHALEVAVGERPEAAMCVAILGADAGMKHEGAYARQLEDLRLQDHLAAGDGDVRLERGEKLARVGRIRGRHHEPRDGVEVRRVAAAEPRDLLFLPGRVAAGERHARIGAERHDIEKLQEADALDLALGRAPARPAAITDEDETS